MLKALIIGADSVSPDIVFRNRELLPTLRHMMENGASAAYDAYVQKGYAGSYSSEQNWASIYTGLAPKEHKINTNSSRGECRRPGMRDFDGLQPFWKILNDNGYSVGLWAADNCAEPVSIQGYCISAKYQMLETPAPVRLVKRELQLCDKDRHLAQYLPGELPSRLYPKTLEQQGFCFEELRKDPNLAEAAISKYHFQDALQNFQQELDYWLEAMIKVQHESLVDVLYLYTPTTDVIAHCSLYCDDAPVLLAAYQMLDQFIGALVDQFSPEFTIFLSDHGQQNFKDLIRCSDLEIQREAFAARDEVLWLRNGYIAFEAHNGALLFTAHALKGTFIATGPGIRCASVQGMRTVDIYPTLLELFGIRVPQNRVGWVIDVFERRLVNKGRLLQMDHTESRSIALVQTQSVSDTDIILNELFLEHRFAHITLVGEEKYREIFCGNPRTSAFIAWEQFHISDFDEVYCGVKCGNGQTMRHIKLYGGES